MELVAQPGGLQHYPDPTWIDITCLAVQ